MHNQLSNPKLVAHYLSNKKPVHNLQMLSNLYTVKKNTKYEYIFTRLFKVKNKFPYVLYNYIQDYTLYPSSFSCHAGVLLA